MQEKNITSKSETGDWPQEKEIFAGKEESRRKKNKRKKERERNQKLIQENFRKIMK